MKSFGKYLSLFLFVCLFDLHSCDYVENYYCEEDNCYDGEYLFIFIYLLSSQSVLSGLRIYLLVTGTM